MPLQKTHIKYVHGDLLEHPGRFIMHGCNAQGVMASGVAKEIRETYPLAFTKYREKYEEDNHLELGVVIPVDCGRHVVFNAITQEFYGRDGKRYVDYDAISTALDQISTMIRLVEMNEIGGSFIGTRGYGWKSLENKPDKEELALPLIGAGLGGGDWKIIQSLLMKEYSFQPVVYIREIEQYEKILKEYQNYVDCL